MREWIEEALAPGTILDHRYRVLRVIGEGGFGITYEALNERINRRVAVKELFISAYLNRDCKVSDKVTVRTQKEIFASAKERFLKEARIISDFSVEPGVVSILDYFEANGTAYIVMEYLEGQTLEYYYEKNGQIQDIELFRLLLPMMQTLEKIHNCGVIHRDISPDNIILLPDQSIKLIDFGSARDCIVRQTHTIELKAGYAPPEQYGEGIQGPWTDIYALCAVIYHGITGKKPENSVMRTLKDELQMPSELGIKIKPETEQILRKGLRLNPEERWQNMGELRKTVQSFVKPEKKKIPGWLKGTGGMALAAGLGIVLTGLGQSYCQNHPEKFLFPGERTEHVILTPDEKMTSQEYQEAKDIIAQRLDALVGNDHYFMRTEDEQIDLWMVFPQLENESGDIESKEEDLINRFLVHPMKLQPTIIYMKNGIIGNRYSELDRDEILSVKVKKGEIPIPYYLPEQVKENNSISGDAYLEITVSQETAERLKEHMQEIWKKDGNFMVLKLDQETEGNQTLFLCTDPDGDWTVFYQPLEFVDSERWRAIWEISELPENMQFCLEKKVNWYTNDGKKLWGGMQKEEKKIKKPFVILEYEQEWKSSELSDAGWKEKVLDVKRKLDALKIPYAMGNAADNAKKLIVKVEQKNMSPTLAEVLMDGAESIFVSDGKQDTISVQYGGKIFIDRLDEEELALSCELGGYDQSSLSEWAKEKLKDGEKYVYLQVSGYKVSRIELQQIAKNGTLEFRENLWNEGKNFTEEDRPLLKFIQAILDTKKDIQDYYELNDMEYHGEDGRREIEASCQDTYYFPDQEEYAKISKIVKAWNKDAEVKEKVYPTFYTLTVSLKLDLSRSYAGKVTDIVEKLFQEATEELERYQSVYIYLDNVEQTQKLTFIRREGKWWLDYRMLGNTTDPLEEELRERIKNSEFFKDYITENSGWKISDSEGTQ